ncbi:multiple cyclophane-containing RiPP AmcA [Saccharopolyspora phatthalungensis]|uniref:Uncharacterized protein n=1 Tax=Saccharopolyspora phatthalungensis TaxID=664693 RepID=A0A840PX80_9PSEU|nr:multiple cyclophane-containing RiPP AmcA [Saccharopolyspora phatthalungensis]MBB5152524.1 hypothetical protein [Saccharopolyspora phatthalungensis]
MLQGETVELASKVREAEAGLRGLIRRRPHPSPVYNWDNRDSWDNKTGGGGFDNRPGWDNWNKR